MKKWLRPKLAETTAVCKLTSSNVYLLLSILYKCTHLQVVKMFVYSTAQPCMNKVSALYHHVSLSRNELEVSNLSNLYHLDLCIQ